MSWCSKDATDRHMPSLSFSMRSSPDLVNQGVPLDPDLRRLNNFREFLDARRKVLADMVNDFIKEALEG